MRQNSTATSRQPIPGPAAIVIFCADQELRRNLTEALQEDAAVAVVGVRDNASSLRELIDRLFPSAVLADAPPRELLAQWRRRHDQPRLIVLLENPEAEEGFEALAAGGGAPPSPAPPPPRILTPARQKPGG